MRPVKSWINKDAQAALGLFNGVPQLELGNEVRLELEMSYSNCQKFFLMADFQIPLNPPFSKGDFRRNSAKFHPLKRGG
jgi:hypothetical protein